MSAKVSAQTKLDVGAVLVVVAGIATVLIGGEVGAPVISGAGAFASLGAAIVRILQAPKDNGKTYPHSRQEDDSKAELAELSH